MKKSLFSIIAIIIFSLSVTYGQVNAPNILGYKPNKKDTVSKKDDQKPEIFRDRLIVDVYHSFWMGVPSGVNNKKFNPGITVSALWDFKTSNKSPISFGIGLGISYYSQFSDSQLKMANGWVAKYYVLPDGLEYKLNRLNYINGNLPVEFRFRHSSGFKFTVGARVGLVAEISRSYKGNNPDGTSDGLHYKTFDFGNKEKYSIDVYSRIGWKFINVYYSCQLNKLFKKDGGPQMFPMSLGLSLSIF